LFFLALIGGAGWWGAVFGIHFFSRGVLKERGVSFVSGGVI
jgi:hypothetical protein